MRSIGKVVLASLALALGAACALAPALERGPGADTPRTLPGPMGPGYASPFDGSWEAGEPESYTLDPRLR